MENKEKKIDAAELNDENLENVSGGALHLALWEDELKRCDICGGYRRELYWYRHKNYCSECKEKAGF